MATGIGEQLMSQVGGSVIGQVGNMMGMMTGMDKYQDMRQLEQQQKLTDIQSAANQKLMESSYGLQKDMWDYTNYENQVEHLKKAGLNPALIYGMGGGGGSTTGSGTASVEGGQAANSAQQTQANAAEQGMALQAAKLMSEIDVNKSIAQKNTSEAEKTAGVDTELTKNKTQEVKANIEKLKADTNLSGANWELNKLQQNSLEIANEYNERNNNYLLQQNFSISRKLYVEAGISEATKETIIEQAKADLENTIQNTLTSKGLAKLNEAQIEGIKNSIQVSNEQLKINREALENALNIAIMNNSNGTITKDLKGVHKLIMESFEQIGTLFD